MKEEKRENCLFWEARKMERRKNGDINKAERKRGNDI